MVLNIFIYITILIIIIMKTIILFFFFIVSFFSISQCNGYYIYESFTSSLPTQQGTWGQSSITYNTASLRTGTNNLSFNASGDFIRTPIIPNPGVITFWIRRSNTSATHNFVVETSPDNSTWTTRNTYSANPGTTYSQRTVDLTSLNLTNVHIRIRDTRASGTNVWYLEDLGITSTDASTNTLIPFVTACNQTLNSSYTYTITDDGGPSTGGYTNSVNRTFTFTPSDNTKKLKLSFTQLDLETSYDYLYVYDGANTSATLLATINGTTLPSDIVAENSAGQLTIRWTTDISNTGLWGGFSTNITSITPCTTPTNGGTLSTNKTETIVNDVVSLTTTGNGGSITKIEWSYNNFTSVAGSVSNPANPYNIALNVQQSSVYFRTTSKDGTCPSGNSNIVEIYLESAPPYSTGVADGDYISNVTLGNINNTSTNDGDAYQNFTSQIIELTKGDIYNISVSATNTLSPGQGAAAWIDYNGDGTFQTTENVMLKSPANTNSQSFTVPSDAVTSDVKMRVLSVWNATPNVDAYYSTGYGYGEIEEYTVRLSEPTPLPVELIYFNAVTYPLWDVIKWSTASEQNSSHFDLEMSNDGENWVFITKKQAAGNSQQNINYSHINYNNKGGIFYYILKQYDIDGKNKIYGPISVNRTESTKKIIKYVNALGQEVNLETKGIIFEVYDDGTTKKIIR